MSTLRLAHTVTLIRALEECIGPISQFFDAVRQLTGWEWSVIGGGPDPRLGGMLNVSRHESIWLTWKQATSNFMEKHLNPYLSYLGTVFTEEDRKKRALDYVRPVEQEETSSHQEAEAPTMSASTSLQVNLSSPARATMMPFDSPGHSRISVQGLNVFDSPGPSRIGLQGLDGPYSWGFDTSPLGQQPPRPQTPTLLPTFPSTFPSGSGSWPLLVIDFTRYPDHIVEEGVRALGYNEALDTDDTSHCALAFDRNAGVQL
ncbi:hypothetical protein BDR07DRAFT_1496834 [Suillus spraguei]|nr:hypothetical protein BDR07DRAFT_1496834 [Suillus spraguei]